MPSASLDLKVPNVLLGTLSNDNDDGNENVAKKGNLRSFKLNHVYLDPLNMSNAGEFPGVEFFLKGFHSSSKRGRKIRRRLKRQIRRFQAVVVQWTSKKCTQSVMHVQSCCFDH